MRDRFGLDCKSDAIPSFQPKLRLAVLAARFDSELTVQKSEMCRFSGLLEEYGPALDDHIDLYNRVSVGATVIVK